ncbi:hypothetical protein [Polyangium sp. y55x31]|uniref:hypothetical protein n=1 Tax=Polyangium sp. y55x31 TaxID=3042688 RepID=UPI002482E322|nr:hypothetical protein [Polyangium sp. y55x31]MDI1478058.1 hypothetical protein [Polyangium sp. y55x31]
MPATLDQDEAEAAPSLGARRYGDADGSGFFARVLESWPAIDRVLYPVFASACVVYAATVFYGYMHVQTRGGWSAPLDDVFIHFDYARAAARGFPFQWSEGNGFSSGNTSLLYPFTLSLGYLLGFRSLDLMAWAALVACVSTTFFLVAAGRACEPLGRAAKYLVPPAVLSLGALDWSLFSGMENAFHLGVWALMLLPILSIGRAPGEAHAVRRSGMLAGLAGALLYATRPESVVCIAVFAFYAALAVWKPLGFRAAAATLLRASVPGAIVAVAQAVANRVFTGEWAAAGAIVKLALNHPYMNGEQKLDEYLSHLKYVVLRNTQHHFADWIPGQNLPWGWIVPLVALIPFFSKKTRGVAAMLWAQVVTWLLLVSLNGQVRWQNERYTMSAVAWLFVLAAMGLGLLLVPAVEATRRARGLFALRVAIACGVVVLYGVHQAPNMRDQIWFFGRASRNIRDQHVVAGKVLAERKARRVLVGDAGALMYASDLPGLDIIGLGGYHDLPFARAGVNGLGATIELIERIPPEDRPDHMAIYPSWWGDLPGLFGRRLVGVPVVGNVICGGAEKVIYKADWSALDRNGWPRTQREGERIVDELDIGDLVSEKAHGYNFPRPGMGFVVHRVLPEPGQKLRELFDAGRIVPHGEPERARMNAPKRGGRLVVRTVSGRQAAAEVRVDGRLLGKLEARPGPTWTEPSIDLPTDLPPRFELAITPVEGEWITYHVWILEGAGAPSAAR